MAAMNIALTFICLSFVCLLSIDATKICAPGWIAKDTNCYYISPPKRVMTWSSAKQQCTRAGGSLLIVDTIDLKNWIISVLNKRVLAHKGLHWWVGLYKDNTTLPWKWTDASPLNKQLNLWRPNEPNNNGKKGENCAELVYSSKDKVLGLNDLPCDIKYPFVCQTSKQAVSLCDTETIQGWDRMNGKCFKYMDYRRPFADAKASCENAGAQLASPADDATQTLVQNYATKNKRDVWINVVSQPIAANPKYQMVASDGSALSKQYWAKGQPKVQKGQANNTCVRVLNVGIKTARWKTDSCDNEHQYVCSKDPGSCAPGWTPFSRLCYQFNYLHQLSWAGANSYCQRQGSVLIEITSKDQQKNFLGPYLDNMQQAGIASMWIGLSDNPGFAGNFKWTSGAALKYKNWAKTFPNDTQSKADCGVIYTDDSSGAWSNTPNCLQLRGFICQAKENDPIYPAATPAPTYVCNDGWTVSGSTCYKLFLGRMIWSDAQDKCSSNNGRLARVLDQDTQTFFNKLVKQDTWMGLNDRSANGQYYFGTDTPVTSFFANWGKGEPNKRQDLNCGVLSGGATKGKWKMLGCGQKYPFVCEATPSNGGTIAPTTPPVTWSTNCGPNFDENPLNGYCYMFSDQPLSWLDARDFCRNGDRNSELASITSVMEQNYIAGRLTRSSFLSYWVGGTDMWKEGGWGWLDGSGFAFMNWGKGQPDNWKDKQDCLRVDLTAQHVWDDSQCQIRNPFICKKAGKLARPIPTQSTYIEPLCGEGWKALGTTCYEFNAKSANWGSARKQCMLEGGDLASVNSFNVQNFINANIQKESWIGLNDRNKEKTFIWNSNNKTTTLPYTNWATGQPDNKKNQDCVTVQSKADVKGKWRDNSCNGKWGYICQKPATCGDNWSLYGSSCYFFNTSGASWAGARKQCRDVGADLVTIKSTDVQNFLTGKLLRESWTGLNDQIKNKQYTWLDESQKVVFFNWAKTQPDNRDNEDCGTIMKTSGKWRDRSCTEQYGFICQKSAANLFLSCPDGWYNYEGKCYYTGHSNNLASWQDAQSRCQSNSADLVSIQSKKEQDFVYSRIRGVKTPVWIGLNDQDNFAGHRMFSWSDNSLVTFTSWAKGEPNNFHVNENCVAMNRDGSGGWDDYPCNSQVVRGYMCEKEQEPTVVTTPSPLKKGCKSGLGYFTTCYTFVSSKLSFKDADKYCVSKYKGHLATINSRYVQAFVGSELADREGAWWIGLSNSDAQTYKWTSGKTVDYTNWDLSHTGNEKAGGVSINADKPVGLWKNQANLGTKLPFICASPRSGNFPTPPPDKVTPNPTAPCMNYFKEYNSYCYRLFYSSGAGRKTWPQARAMCQRYGGDLVSFHSKDEQDWVVKNIVRYYPGIFWIGINDIDKEKGFRWSDNTPVTYTNWMINQPDDHKGHEDCGELNKNTKQWNDDNCNIAKSYICKVMKGVFPNRNVVIPTSGPNIRCSAHLRNWSYNKGFCYYVSVGRVTFYDSRKYCQRYGGDLLSIHNHDESDFIISKISRSTTDSFWIGLNDIGENGYNWTDASPLNFINWKQNEPNDMYGQQSCVQMIRDGFWQDQNCGYKKKFICKAFNGTAVGTKPPKTTIAPGNCPPGFFGMDTRCYILKGDQKSDQVNWTTAVNRCKQMGQGIVLATISNTLEKDFVTSRVLGMKYKLWIGLNDLASSNVFIWTDNSPVKYTHWAPGEPNGKVPPRWGNPFLRPKQGQEEDCVEMLGSGKFAGYWNDRSCSAVNGYVCQTQRSTSYPAQATSPIPAYCKAGYTVYGTSCYKVDTARRTWQDASTSCQNDGGYLLSIASNMEQSFVRTLIHNQSSVAWIGLSQTQASGLYDWTDGWPVTFTAWGRGEPSRNGQACVVFVERTGHWMDVLCNYKAASICKIHTGSPPIFTTRKPGYCANPSWVTGGDYCYFLSKSRRASDAFKSWPDAQYTCEKLGMSLATIHNKADNDFIQSLLKSSQYNRGYAAWLGLYSRQGGGFQWDDNSVVAFDNWAKNEPSNNRSRMDEECVGMGPNTGTWYDLSCTNKFRYVCSTLKIIPTPISINLTTTTSTPLPIITQASGNPQTNQPITQKPVTQKPVTQKPVTQRPKTNRPQTQPPVRRTTPRQHPPLTFAPTRRPFTAFPPQKTTQPPRQTLPPHPTRSPGYQRFQGNKPDQGGGISGGGIAGICIALIATAALVTLGVIYFRRRQVSLRLQSTVGFDNALYNKTGDSVDIGGND